MEGKTVSLLLTVAALLLSVGSVLILRAAWLSDAKSRGDRPRKARNVAYDGSLRRAA
jgi:hypothetical protein